MSNMRSPFFMATVVFAILGVVFLGDAKYAAFILLVIAICCAVLGFFAAAKARKNGSGTIQLH